MKKTFLCSTSSIKMPLPTRPAVLRGLWHNQRTTLESSSAMNPLNESDGRSLIWSTIRTLTLQTETAKTCPFPSLIFVVQTARRRGRHVSGRTVETLGSRGKSPSVALCKHWTCSTRRGPHKAPDHTPTSLRQQFHETIARSFGVSNHRINLDVTNITKGSNPQHELHHCHKQNFSDVTFSQLRCPLIKFIVQHVHPSHGSDTRGFN